MLAESVGGIGGHQTLQISNTTLVVRLNNFRKLMTVPPTHIVSLIAELLQGNEIRRSTFLLVVRNKFSMYSIEIDVRTSRTLLHSRTRYNIKWQVGSADGQNRIGSQAHSAGGFLSYLCNKLYREQMRRGHIGIDRSLKPCSLLKLSSITESERK